MGQPACLAPRVSLVFNFISNFDGVKEREGFGDAHSKIRLLARLQITQVTLQMRNAGYVHLLLMPAPASLYSTSTLLGHFQQTIQLNSRGGEQRDRPEQRPESPLSLVFARPRARGAKGRRDQRRPETISP